MASTAWTAPRADLVAELAKTRQERDLVTARLQIRLAKEAERRAIDRERMRRRRAQTRHLETAAAVAEATVIQPDPLAAQHVADLIAALKEKP